MKVLFLDIDGVLNCSRSAVAFNGCPFDVTEKGLAMFDMIAVNLLRGLCAAGEIKVVLSSTWRLDPNWRDIGTALGLPIIDRTPSMLGPRGKEIAAWLADHPEVEHYGIVDDDGDMLAEQKPFFAQTNFQDGLTWAPFSKLCGILNVNEYDCCPARVRQPSPGTLQWDEPDAQPEASTTGAPK